MNISTSVISQIASFEKPQDDNLDFNLRISHHQLSLLQSKGKGTSLSFGASNINGLIMGLNDVLNNRQT